MTLPRRFLDSESDADDFERAILRSEAQGQPPEEMERWVLARVLAAAAPIVPGGAGPGVPVQTATGGALGTGALAKGAALGGLAKGFALGIGVSLAAAAGNHFLVGKPSREVGRSSSVAIASASAAALPQRSTSPVTAPVEPSPATGSRVVEPSLHPKAAAEPPPVAGAPAERAVGAPSVASFPIVDERALAKSRLKEEAALLRRARSELRAGALAAAFATLEASRQKFTAPELSQEREALVIELLYRSGERVAAAARARDFLARFPESPHAAAVRAFAGDAR